MLEVLYCTGIRRAELAHLLVSDLDADRRTLFVRQGKGRKDRTVPIGTRALAWVDGYLDRSPTQAGDRAGPGGAVPDRRRHRVQP